MTDRDSANSNINPRRADEAIDFSSVPPASLVRAAADGELDAEGEARLSDHADAFPGTDRRAEFDRGLREACAKAMTVETPAGLADRVRAAIAADTGTTTAAPPTPTAEEDAAFADAVEARSAQTRDRSFWSSPAFRGVSAIAALLVIAFTAVFALQSMQSTPVGEGYQVQLAQFVANEHERVTTNDSAAARDRKSVV